jgi:hypothetical protein
MELQGILNTTMLVLIVLFTLTYRSEAEFAGALQLKGRRLLEPCTAAKYAGLQNCADCKTARSVVSCAKCAAGYAKRPSSGSLKCSGEARRRAARRSWMLCTFCASYEPCFQPLLASLLVCCNKMRQSPYLRRELDITHCMLLWSRICTCVCLCTWQTRS